MPLTCRHIRQLHDNFVDSELSPSLTAEVHAHLLQCPECRRQVQMLRTVGDMIARDDTAPSLSSDFASKVVAQLPQVRGDVDSFDRRWGRRLTFNRVLFPALAASLFIAIVIWPRQESGNGTKVAGASAMKSVVDPTMEAVAGTKKAAESLNTLLTISVDQARSDVREGMDKVEQLRRTSSEPLSFTSILLQPFNELPQPVEQPDAKDGKVRF
ncbi:MAG: zf-HC2 domain-containing protein [Planctomycetota bacterium]